MREIVNDPRGEQLPHRDRTELGMLARQLHVLLLEVPTAQRRDIARPQVVELLQQILERPLRFQFRETVEWIEPAVTLLLQNYARARNPISSVAMDEMCDDLPRIPRVRSFVHTCPVFRQLIEQRREHRGRPLQNRNRFIEVEVHILS